MKKLFLHNIGDLAEAQRSSYYRFLLTGITEELRSIPNPFLGLITTPFGNVEESLIYFYTNKVEFKTSDLTLKDCLFNGQTYSIEIFLSCQYSYTQTREKKSFQSSSVSNPSLWPISDHQRNQLKEIRITQPHSLVQIPLLTEDGTFLINGHERIVISQIIRSPGIYFQKEFGSSARKILYTATIISDKGVWTKVLFGRPKQEQKIIRDIRKEFKVRLISKEKTEERDRLKKRKNNQEEDPYELPGHLVFYRKLLKDVDKIIASGEDQIFIRLSDFTQQTREEKQDSKDAYQESYLIQKLLSYEADKLYLETILRYFGLNLQEISDSLKYATNTNVSSLIYGFLGNPAQGQGSGKKKENKKEEKYKDTITEFAETFEFDLIEIWKAIEKKRQEKIRFELDLQDLKEIEAKNKKEGRYTFVDLDHENEEEIKEIDNEDKQLITQIPLFEQKEMKRLLLLDSYAQYVLDSQFNGGHLEYKKTQIELDDESQGYRETDYQQLQKIKKKKRTTIRLFEALELILYKGEPETEEQEKETNDLLRQIEIVKKKQEEIENQVDSIKELYFDNFDSRFSIGKTGRLRINKKFGLNIPSTVTSLTSHDFLGIIDGLLELKYYNRQSDDIDHLENKLIRSVGELIQVQFRAGISRFILPTPTEKEEEENEDYRKRWQAQIRRTSPSPVKSKIVSIKEKVSLFSSFFTKPQANSFLLASLPTTLSFSESFLLQQKQQKMWKKKKRQFSSLFVSHVVERKKKKKYFHLPKLHFVLSDFVNSSTLTKLILDFFKMSQLSQYMDQVNSLSEITQKRRISVFGPNGLKKDHISTVIRDIHPSQYGRLCPIETPEGKNAGLVSSLSLYSRLNALGCIETPYFLMDDQKIYRNKRPIFLDALQETQVGIAFCEKTFSSDLLEKKEIGKLSSSAIDTVQFENDYFSIKQNYSFALKKKKNIAFLTTSPLQMISIATSLIPFVEHNDANRALMGANMQRQAVPLLYTQKPLIGTGLESIACLDSGLVVKNYAEGEICFVSSSKIEVQDKSKQKITYELKKYLRSNQETAIVQRSLVWPGEKVYSGQIIADGPGTNDGELSLGKNLLIAYMPWEGYNYEDAIVINERLVTENILSSVHISEEELVLDMTDSVRGEEKLTPFLPSSVSLSNSKNLQQDGLIAIGSYVKENDILIGKVTVSNPEFSGAKRLFDAITKIAKKTTVSNEQTSGAVVGTGAGAEAEKGKKTGSDSKTNETEKEENSFVHYKDTSCRVPHGTEGRVIEIRIVSNENSLEGENEKKDQSVTIRIFIAQIRKIQIGDKLAGRHGNKGIISRIVPSNDMPYLPDGTPLDILFNPLGVPSRMNVGQVFECLLGLAAEKLGNRFKVMPFDEIYGKETSRILVNQKLKEAAIEKKENWLFDPCYPGKVLLRDGRTGEYFDNPITIGRSYILKLIHMVDDKINARSTGPYAMITEQPLAGKSVKGGQRFGEMEVWALEAYGCSNTLQELLTIKSDDIDGRVDVYESLIFSKEIKKPLPSIPEAFLVLIRELNTLGLQLDFEKVQINDFLDQENPKTSIDLFEIMEIRLQLRSALLHKKEMELMIQTSFLTQKEKEKSKEKTKKSGKK